MFEIINLVLHICMLKCEKLIENLIEIKLSFGKCPLS